MAQETPLPAVARPPAAAEASTQAHLRRGDTISLLAGFGLIYLILQGAATWTGSLYGEAGALICALTLATALLIERVLFRTPLIVALPALGFGRPNGRGLLAAVAICGLLLAYFPAFAWITGTTLTMRDAWPALALGIVLQGGIAEELLWRGYLFGRLQRGRGFWPAATLSMLVMAAAHLLLFATLPFPVAFTATLVSVVISFPLSQLYVLGGNTIWGPALVHAAVQGAIKLVVFPVELQLSGQIGWMLVCVAVSLLAFVVRRPASEAA